MTQEIIANKVAVVIEDWRQSVARNEVGAILEMKGCPILAEKITRLIATELQSLLEQVEKVEKERDDWIERATG